MRTARLIAFLASIVALGACSKPPRPVSDKLARSVDAAQAAAPCSTSIPVEWAHSWPVPRADGGVTVLFYPLAGDPASGPTLYAPAGTAVLSSSGAIAGCGRLAGEPRKLSTRRWSAEAERLDPRAFERRAAELYDDTETAARWYASGKTAAGPERELLRRYAEEFTLLAEPDLLGDYYRANPGFWEWLRAVAGVSIPKS